MRTKKEQLSIDFNDYIAKSDTNESLAPPPTPLHTFTEDEWLNCYLKWFEHFRAMQPAARNEVYWRENKQLNEWVNSMVEASILPYWVSFFGAKSLPHYHRRIKKLRQDNHLD